jgi:hypothetical protein
MDGGARWPHTGFRPAPPPTVTVAADQQHRGRNEVALVALFRLMHLLFAGVPTPVPPVVRSARPRSKAEPTATLRGTSGVDVADM